MVSTKWFQNDLIVIWSPNEFFFDIVVARSQVKKKKFSGHQIASKQLGGCHVSKWKKNQQEKKKKKKLGGPQVSKR
jgi:hypothetical protein